MIQQLISQTPTYVWALLAFLIYRGYQASLNSETTLRRIAIIPLVMLGLALQGMNTAGPLGEGVWLIWALGAAASTLAIWTFSTQEIIVNRAAGTIVQRGSWMPLCLMLAIFTTKYTVAVVSAMHPELVHNLPFATGVSLLYGLFNGLFLGRLARYSAAWMRSPEPVAAL